jgi:hypothetical protein
LEAKQKEVGSVRRIQLVLGALAIVVTSFAAFAGPVMADDLNCRDARGDLIRCDGDLYAPYYNTPGYNAYPVHNNDPYYNAYPFYGDGLFYDDDIIEAYLEGDYEELWEETADFYGYW